MLLAMSSYAFPWPLPIDWHLSWPLQYNGIDPYYIIVKCKGGVDVIHTDEETLFVTIDV